MLIESYDSYEITSAGETIKSNEHCDCCGQNIRFVHIISTEDGNTLKVGGTCIKKFEDDTTAMIAEEKALKRAAKETEKKNTRRAFNALNKIINEMVNENHLESSELVEAYRAGRKEHKSGAQYRAAMEIMKNGIIAPCKVNAAWSERIAA